MKRIVIFIAFLQLFMCVFTSCKTQKETALRLYAAASEQYVLHNFEKAESFAKAAVGADKSLYQADFLIARICFFTKRYKEAQKALVRLVARHPDFTEARIWLIRNCLVSGNFQMAQQLLENEVILNSSDWRVFYLYSLFYRKTECFEKELVMLKNAELSLSEASKVYAAAGIAWGTLNMSEKESEYFEKARLIGNIFEDFYGSINEK